MKSLFFFSIMTNGDSDYTPIDKEEYIMATWKNLDTLSSYDKLSGLKNHVDIATAMSGEQGGERVKNYSTPMAAGLQYNYAAKEVDETVLTALAELADEAQLIDKFEELYNGAVINTGENVWFCITWHVHSWVILSLLTALTNVTSMWHSRKKLLILLIKYMR